MYPQFQNGVGMLIPVIFFQKAMNQYTIFKTVLLY